MLPQTCICRTVGILWNHIFWVVLFYFPIIEYEYCVLKKNSRGITHSHTLQKRTSPTLAGLVKKSLMGALSSFFFRFWIGSWTASWGSSRSESLSLSAVSLTEESFSGDAGAEAARCFFDGSGVLSKPMRRSRSEIKLGEVLNALYLSLLSSLHGWTFCALLLQP